jgi:hypothetical protein
MNRFYIQNSNFNQIPNKPGVYNWYYPFIIFDNDSYEDFHTRVSFFLEHSMIDQGTGIQFQKTTNWRLWEINLITKITPKKELKFKWEILKSNTKLREAIASSSIMFQPLYVGCAENLAKRITTHRSGKSGFSKRFKDLCDLFEKKYSPQKCPIGAFDIDSLHLTYTVLNSVAEVPIFEDVVQSFCNPILSIK